MAQPSLQDLISAVDFTAYPTVSASVLNQALATLQGNTGIGLLLYTVDSSIGVPQVPDPTQDVNHNKWEHYGWLRIPFTGASDKTGTIYTWNNDIVSDPIYLKWVTTKIDLTTINNEISVLQTSVTTALNTANAASANANNAVTVANAAGVIANNAATQAAAALASATTANTNATTALNIANSATTVANAAQAAATTALANAAAAQGAANAAAAIASQALLINTYGNRIKFNVSGTYSWTCPSGITSLNVICIGAGGGGSVAGGTAGGGGSGQTSASILTVVPGTAYPVVVGAGGAVNGQNGSDSVFGASLVVAKAGTGANNAGGTVGQGGSTGGVGQNIVNGINGFAFNDANTPYFGAPSTKFGGGKGNSIGQGEGAGGGSGTVPGQNGGKGADGSVILIF